MAERGGRGRVTPRGPGTRFMLHYRQMRRR